MKAHRLTAVLALLTLRAAAQELTTAVLDAGGSLTAGGDVEVAGSFGTFSGVSDSGDITARAGFPGQIYDPARISITPRSAVIANNTQTQFSAEVVCDDDTLLPSTTAAWSVDSQWLTVLPNGEVTAGLLPADFLATLTASSHGVTGTATLTVLDFSPDDFGAYANDGLPDAWQTLHFGAKNPGAAPAADPDNDGQNNQTEYLAGTDPLDAASLLQFRFGPDPAPGVKSLLFSPFLPGRTYMLEWSGESAVPWTALPDAPVAGAIPGEGQFSDAPAAEARRLYRLRITVP